MTPPVLDAIDRSILAELAVDGRVAYATLAPVVGLSQAAVRQRVQRLVSSGVVRIVAVTDPVALGFGLVATLGIEVEGDPAGLVDELAALPQVSRVVEVAGRFDVLAEVRAVDSAGLRELLAREVRPLPGVRHVEVLTHLDSERA